MEDAVDLQMFCRVLEKERVPGLQTHICLHHIPAPCTGERRDEDYHIPGEAHGELGRGTLPSHWPLNVDMPELRTHTESSTGEDVHCVRNSRREF